MSQNRTPIDHLLPQIVQTLAEQPTLILQAPPGAGKTTCVPLALLKSELLNDKKILLLEPRRLAASNAAGYMAGQIGERVGQTVGYSIRYQRQVSAATRIEVITEGILTRRLHQDPELKDVGLVIFDEFHERHLLSDLALALCLDVQHGLRADLKILIMSATLDSQPLAERLQAPLLTSAGRSYPVDIRYLPGKTHGSLVETTVAAIRQALSETTGDLLVFLPGEAEIRRCQQQLADLTSLLICPLYGNLPFVAQEQAILRAAQRKIVLATNIAETSLTIEGIGVVIDCGFSRQNRFDSGNGLTRLQLGRISQASATQRAGRAGRLGPGTCYRLWSESTQQALLPFTPPEIRSADLSPLVLDLLAWGVSDPATLFWLDPPNPAAWQNGIALLELLGALNPRQQLNETGHKLAQFPAHPRIGRLLLAATEHNLLDLGCDLAALLSEPDPWFKKMAVRSSDSDILDRLEAFWQQHQSGEFSAVARASQYWRHYFKRPAVGRKTSATTTQLALLLAAAYPDRIGKARQSGAKRYLLSSGQGVLLSERSALQQSEYLLAIDLRGQKSGEAEIRLASRIDKATLETLYPQRPWEPQCDWNPDEGRIIACEQQRIGALVINQRPAQPSQEQTSRAILSAIRSAGLHLLNWSQAAERFKARMQFLHQMVDPHDWPDVSEPVLLETLEKWLLPFLGKVRNLTELRQIDLYPALSSLLSWQQRSQLDRLAPEKIEVPSGSKISLHYPQGATPVLAVKLQEMFGQSDTPTIAGGQVPLVIQLLSPAGRPLQITQDLRHFWEQGYPEVKKEMKGRYPKHPWPDDPHNALPTAKTKRKLSPQER